MYVISLRRHYPDQVGRSVHNYTLSAKKLPRVTLTLSAPGNFADRQLKVPKECLSYFLWMEISGKLFPSDSSELCGRLRCLLAGGGFRKCSCRQLFTY